MKKTAVVLLLVVICVIIVAVVWNRGGLSSGTSSGEESQTDKDTSNDPVGTGSGGSSNNPAATEAGGSSNSPAVTEVGGSSNNPVGTGAGGSSNDPVGTEASGSTDTASGNQTEKEVEMVTISFDSTGGDPVGPIKVEKGSSVSQLPRPEKDGYHFEGWYKGINPLREEVYSLTTFNEDTLLYANWWCRVKVSDQTVTGLSNAYYYSPYSTLTFPAEYDGAPVTAIKDYAFRSCNILQSVVIPETIVSIGDSAFDTCEDLSSVSIATGTIGSYAFYYCENLKRITLGDGVTSIGDNAFLWCGALKTVSIGSGLTSIGANAFKLCSSLTEITYNGTVAKWNSIEKGADWDKNTAPYTVHCTDGDIEIAE